MTCLSNTSVGQIKIVALGLAALPLFFASLAIAQRRNAPPAEEEGPVFHEYRGVQIGMTVEDARKKLGNPKDKGDEEDLYIFSEKETAQIIYDKEHKVSALSVDFLMGANGIPTPKTVLGADIEPKPDGSMHKMVRYTKAGCWVSYSRTAGDSPMVSITIQRIN